jgi:hypothetical protein
VREWWEWWEWLGLHRAGMAVPKAGERRARG